MSDTKRKGQIVPRWLVKSVEKKAQHLITFGADVEICRGKKSVKVLSEGCAFYIPCKKYVLEKKTRRRVKGFTFHDV